MSTYQVRRCSWRFAHSVSSGDSNVEVSKLRAFPFVATDARLQKGGVQKVPGEEWRDRCAHQGARGPVRGARETSQRRGLHQAIHGRSNRCRHRGDQVSTARLFPLGYSRAPWGWDAEAKRCRAENDELKKQTEELQKTNSELLERVRASLAATDIGIEAR
eukprot:scaffold53_cov193-Pinguiococcus_pyrenoidosus.AAC.3